jgi:hypothetical protein
MLRPFKARRIYDEYTANYYKPRGWTETAYVSQKENCPVYESTAVETETMPLSGHGRGERRNI